jgi:hypothetical protein
MSVPAPATEDLPEDPHERWRFLRDVLVFQVKLIIGKLHNFIFVPISLVAAAADLFFKSGRQGARFYKVMEWARHGDEAIDLYSALHGHEENVPPTFSIDALVTRVEGVIVREYEKGGTAATVKTAVDRVLNQVQREAGPGKFNPEDIVKRAADHIRDRMRRPPPPPPV